MCAPVTPPTQIERTLDAIEERKGAEIREYNDIAVGSSCFIPNLSGIYTLQGYVQKKTIYKNYTNYLQKKTYILRGGLDPTPSPLALALPGLATRRRIWSRWMGGDAGALTGHSNTRPPAHEAMA